MPFPFEVPFKEVQSHIDRYVDEVEGVPESVGGERRFDSFYATFF